MLHSELASSSESNLRLIQMFSDERVLFSENLSINFWKRNARNCRFTWTHDESWTMIKWSDDDLFLVKFFRHHRLRRWSVDRLSLFFATNSIGWIDNLDSIGSRCCGNHRCRSRMGRNWIRSSDPDSEFFTTTGLLFPFNPNLIGFSLLHFCSFRFLRRLKAS